MKEEHPQSSELGNLLNKAYMLRMQALLKCEPRDEYEINKLIQDAKSSGYNEIEKIRDDCEDEIIIARLNKIIKNKETKKAGELVESIKDSDKKQQWLIKLQQAQDTLNLHKTIIPQTTDSVIPNVMPTNNAGLPKEPPNVSSEDKEETSYRRISEDLSNRDENSSKPIEIQEQEKKAEEPSMLSQQNTHANPSTTNTEPNNNLKGHPRRFQLLKGVGKIVFGAMFIALGILLKIFVPMTFGTSLAVSIPLIAVGGLLAGWGIGDFIITATRVKQSNTAINKGKGISDSLSPPTKGAGSQIYLSPVGLYNQKTSSQAGLPVPGNDVSSDYKASKFGKN